MSGPRAVFCGVALLAVGAAYACLIALSPTQAELTGRLGVCTPKMIIAEPTGCARLRDRPRLFLVHFDSSATTTSRRVVAVGADRTFSASVAQGHYALWIDDNGTLRLIANPANQYALLVDARGPLVNLGALAPDSGWQSEGTVFDT
jgi:hypothetical protein